MKILAQLMVTVAALKAAVYIGQDAYALIGLGLLYALVTVAIWAQSTPGTTTGTTGAVTVARRLPAALPVAPAALPVAPVVPYTRQAPTAVPKVDTGTATGEQMYYEVERKAINGVLAPFGYISQGKILVRARAVVYPLTYSQRRRDGKIVKIKVQAVEEHLPNLTVTINNLRDAYGFADAGIVVSYNPFALIINAVHDKPLPWAAAAGMAPGQANLGLAAAKATDTPVIWDISDDEDEYFAMLLAGIPKAGKTTLARSILVQLAKGMAPDALRFYIVENPKGDFRPLAQLPHVARYVGPDQVLDLLRYVDAELCQGEPDPARPYSVVVIDEIQRYALDPAYRDEFLSLINRILGVGRALRVRLMLATPRPSAEMLSNAVMELLQMKIAGQLGAAGSRIVLRSDNAERLTAKGAFILLRDGRETMFYGYHLTAEDLANEVGAIVAQYGVAKPAPVAKAAPVVAQTALRFDGETIRPDVLAFVASNYDKSKGDLRHGTKGEALKKFYGVTDVRSKTAAPARKNLLATVGYYRQAK